MIQPGTILPPELETGPIAVPVPGGALPAEYQNLEAPPAVTTLTPEAFASAPIAAPILPLPVAGAPALAPPGIAAPPPAVEPPPPTVPPAAAHTAPGIPSVPGAGRLKVPGSADEVAAIREASAGTQDAFTAQGNAQAAASDEEAAARALGRERNDAQQAIIREQQAQRDVAVRAINDDQQRAYDQARKATIPGFFEGRPGALAAAAVSMALGEASRGLIAFGTGANVGNTAKDIIDRQITTYLTTRKEEIDNLFKYAAARNMLGEQQKAQWATKLNDLQFDAAALHQAMADHVLEVAAASKGRVNQAQAQVLAKQQAEAAVQLEQKARETNFNNQLSLKRLGIEAYNAQSERIRALQDKQAQVEIKIGQQIDTDMAALERRVAKPREALGKIDNLVAEMDAAYAARDPNRLAATIVAFKEAVGPLFAGGKTTGNLTKQLDAMGTTKDEIQKTLGKLTGGNTVGDTQFKRYREMALVGAHGLAVDIGDNRQAYVKKYLGPGGLANTPEKKQRFLNDLNAITSEVKVGGRPLFQEGGATPATPAPASHSSLPPGAIPGTMNGKRGYVLNGAFVAQ